VIRYLYNTRYFAIVYSTTEEIQELIITTNVSFTEYEMTRKSSYRYTISLFRGLVA